MIPQGMMGVFVVVGVVAVFGLAVGGYAPLSLATDVGLTDEQVCEALDRDGREAVQRLEASGFPHASTSSVETYRLVRGEQVEAAVRIDWQSQTASCITLGKNDPVTAEVRMSDGAYKVVVGELRNVIETGSTSGANWGNLVTVWIGTSIHVPGNEDYGPKLKNEWAKWSTGRLAEAL